MSKKSKKLVGALLTGVMTVSSVIEAVSLMEIKNVEAVSNKDVHAVHAKVGHITYSLKNNYLGLKNVGQWQQYIKEAKALNSKLVNGSSKDKYAARIEQAEALVNAAARVNHVEKSMATNARVMRNVPQWEVYIDLAKTDLAKVDKVLFKDQYNKLLERAALRNEAIGIVKDNVKKLDLLKKDGSKVSKLDYEYSVEITGNKTTLSDSKVKGDLKITGNNNNLVNVTVDGKLIVDPGKDGFVNITGVKAKEIVVLSGAEKSVYIDATIAEKLTVSSSTNVRVKVTGKTEFKATEISSSSIFENVTGDLGKVTIGGDKAIEVKYNDAKDTPVVIINSIKLEEGSNTIKNATVNSDVKGLKVEGNFTSLTVEKIGDKNISISGKIEKVNVNTDAKVKVEKGSIGIVVGKDGSTVKVEVGSGATVSNTTGATTTGNASTGSSSSTVVESKSKVTKVEVVSGKEVVVRAVDTTESKIRVENDTTVDDLKAAIKVTKGNIKVYTDDTKAKEATGTDIVIEAMVVEAVAEDTTISQVYIIEISYLNTFQFSNGKVTGYSGTRTDIVIPDMINGEAVTEIGINAFKGKKLTSVKIPETVKNIGMNAFAMNNLTEIKFPKSIKEIGNMAFYSNRIKSVTIPEGFKYVPSGIFGKNELTSVVMPEGIKDIGLSAFADNKLESVIIPNTVETIGAYAFKNNQLKSISIPASVNTIGKSTFDGNINISLRYTKLEETIKVAESIDTTGKVAEKVQALIEAIKSGKDVNNKTNATINEVNVVVANINNAIEILEFTIVNGEITGYSGARTDIVIPDMINAETVTGIGANVFKGKKLTSVKIPETVNSIGMSAFAMNNLTEIKFPKNIKEIGNMAFYSNKIRSVTIPEKLTYIPTGIFGKNELTSVVMSEGIESIGLSAFADNKLESVIIPNTVEIIGGSAFKNNQLKSISIPINVSVIGKDAFAGNVNVNLRYTKLEEIIKTAEGIDINGKLKEKVQALIEAIISGKDINNKSNATIGEVNTVIADINNAIKALGQVEDEKPDEEGSQKEWNVKDFQYEGRIITGFSESGKERFKTNKDIILSSVNEAGEAITEIGDKAFLIADYSSKQNPEIGINSVVIPKTVTTIGKEAFRYNALTSIDIPNGVTTIKMSAFNGNKLQSLVIPDSVINLEGGAFTLNEIASLKLSSGLKTIAPAFAFNKLTTLTIPEGVTRIDDLAFSDNELIEVKIPSTLTYLSGLNNNSFKSITIPQNVTELGFKAFASNKMTSVTIPGNVKIIGRRAFWNTWHDQFLNSVTIKEGVEKIDEYAFANNQLKDVELPSSLKELHAYSFDTNLGYDGLVHLFTPNYENPNNFIENKRHVINPAKLTIKYVFGENVLKEDNTFKNPTTGNYLHIGDKGVEITPEYSNNEYELKYKDPISVDLNNKENVITVECKKKDIIEKVTIKSIVSVGAIAVDFGTAKDVAINKLPKKTFIVDSNNDEHEVALTWILEEYDGSKSGQYTATGIFELPEGVVQSEPETKLEVKENIIVKENPKNVQNSVWQVEDFNYETTKESSPMFYPIKTYPAGSVFEIVAVTGFSETGLEKLKTNKDLVLPKVNKEGQGIRYIKPTAFANMGLTSLTIPEGLDGAVIGAGAFRENQLNKVFIPEGVKEIDALAFYKNNLTYVDFPGSMRKIGNQAFAYNKLVSATFAESRENICSICLDSSSFYENQLTSITILKEVNKVHEDAFKNNKGHENDGNKVYIFMAKIDPENNGLFENSNYHKIIPLSQESVE